MTELKGVYNWAQLGLCLNIPKHTLEEIRDNHGIGFNAVEKCKMKMLSIWVDTFKKPTWSALVAALCASGRRATANKIAAKYGKSETS